MLKEFATHGNSCIAQAQQSMHFNQPESKHKNIASQ